MSGLATWELLLAAIAGAAAIAAVLVLPPFIRNALARHTSRTAAEVRESYEPLLRDLWSGEMHRKLGALFAMQGIVRRANERAGLGPVLVAFIRHRLNADSDGSALGFEDVRLALAVLVSAVADTGLRRPPQAPDLSGIDFRHAPLSGVDLHGFRLAHCNFDGCRLSRANLSGCDFTGTIFARADLRNANLQGADLSNADMSNADLTRARLKGAKTASTNFGGAILVGAGGLTQEQLDAAFGDAGTALPEEFRIAAVRSRRPLAAGVTA